MSLLLLVDILEHVALKAAYSSMRPRMCLTKITTSPSSRSISALPLLLLVGLVDGLQLVAGGAGGDALAGSLPAPRRRGCTGRADAERVPHHVHHGELVQRGRLQAVDGIDRPRVPRSGPAWPSAGGSPARTGRASRDRCSCPARSPSTADCRGPCRQPSPHMAGFWNARRCDPDHLPTVGELVGRLPIHAPHGPETGRSSPRG